MYHMALSVKSAMLADAAAVAEGKLYIHGGQWDQMLAQSVPFRHPAMCLVLVIEVPYDDALRPHEVGVTLDLDGSRQEQWGMMAHLETGHAPGTARGAPSFLPLAVPIRDLEIHHAGRYDWIVTLDGVPAERVSMQVNLAPKPPGTGSSPP